MFARSSFYENKVLRPNWPPPLEHNELAQSCPDSLGTARPPRRVPWQGLIVRKKPRSQQEPCSNFELQNGGLQRKPAGGH